MNRYLAQEKRVFDISKFTVVGSPTITSDGVASGFSETSYIDAIKLLPNDKSWEVQIEYTVSQADTATTNSKYIIYNSSGDKGIILIWLSWNSNADYLDFIINEEGGTQSTVRITSNTKFVANDNLNITIGYDGQNYYQKTYKNGALLQENYTASTEIVRQSDTGFLRLGARAGSVNYCLGSIDLTKFKIVVDNQTVFTGTKPVHLLERRKPKVWNKGQFTIVGNPSISDDGVASGFSGANGLTIYATDLSKANSWLIEMRVGNITVDQTYFQGLISGGVNFNYPQLFCTSGSRRITIRLSSDGTSWNIANSVASTATIPLNGYIDIKFSFDGTAYILEYKNPDEDTYQVGATITNSNKVNCSATDLFIGKRLTSGDAFLGSIDLKSFKIYTDNNLVFDGGAETYVYDPSKFTIVGSPTITEYGVASDFSGSNRITKTFDYSGNTLQIEEVFYFQNDADGGNLLQIRQSNNTTNVLRVFQRDNNALQLYAVSGGTLTIINGEYTPATNDLIKIKAKINSDKTVTLTVVNITQNKTVTKTSTGTIPNEPSATGNILYIGNANGHEHYAGSIDLPYTSITVDGKEVFTGAKENYYVLRS